MDELNCDVAVIGAGSAGLAAERTARRAGAHTLLIDDRFAGTTCATVGCMPSKLLIAAAQAAHAVRGAHRFGVRATAPTIDGPAVLQRLRRHRDEFATAMRESFTEIPQGIRVQARARFVTATTLALDTGARVRAKAIVVATGSRPHVPEQFAALGPCLLTNETIFELHDLPASVAVIGAGPLGLELAQALVRLGVDCAVFDSGHRLAGLKDQAVEDELATILSHELPLHLGVKIDARREGDGARLTWRGGSSGSRRFERVLVATGRPPQVDGLALSETGLALDDKGMPSIDRATLQCGHAPIFFAGDAYGDRPVLHEASAEGAIAGRNAACFPTVSPSRRGPAFSIMFTDPPLAVLGEPARADSVIGQSSYADQGRAKIEARNAGRVRLYAEPRDGRLTGATMLGPGMDHMAHLLAWAIARGDTATSLLDLPFYHPTLEEGLKNALREICTAVHAPTPPDRDDGVSAGA